MKVPQFPTDECITETRINPLYEIDQDSFRKGEGSYDTKYQIYSDGSKMGNHLGAGWAIFTDENGTQTPTHEGQEYLGTMATVYQAEITAITRACENLLELPSSNVTIFSDSQAALMALDKHWISSKITLECLDTLNYLGSRGWGVKLKWIEPTRALRETKKPMP